MIENNKYSWENINIKQFKLIETILKEKTYGDNRDIEKYIELLSVILNKDYEYFDNLNVQEFNKLRNEVLSFMTEEIKIDIEFNTNTIKKTQYHLNGKNYNVTLSANQMTSGQFMDFVMFYDKNPNDLVNLLSTILIPEGTYFKKEKILVYHNSAYVVNILGVKILKKDLEEDRDYHFEEVMVEVPFKYAKGYDIEKVKSDIENYLPITKALGLCFFFQKESEALSKVLKSYSIKKLKKQIKILKKEMLKEKNPDRKELIQSSIDLIEQQMLGWIQ